MAQSSQIPQSDAREIAAQERSRTGWLRLRQQLSKISPSDIARLLLVILAIVAIVWLGVASWPALAPFVIGAFIAYLLYPIVNALDRILPRPVAALITLVAFFGLIIAIIVALVPTFVEQAIRLYTNNLTPDKLQSLRQALSDYLQSQQEPLRSILSDYVQRVGAQLQTRIDTFFGQLAGQNVSLLVRLFNTFGVIFGLLVLPFWILAVITGQRKTAQAIRNGLPNWLSSDIWAVIRIVDRTLSAFLRGQLVLGLAIGAIFYMELALLGRFTPYQVRYPVLAALLAGVLQLIPQVGALIGILLIFFLSLSNGIQFSLIMVGLYLAAQFLVSQLISGHVNRRVIDINPALLALLITAVSQFGLIWVLLSAPILAIARDLFRYAYGRVGDPASPAGLLPGETVGTRQPVRSPPGTVSGAQPGSASNAYGRSQSPR